MSNCYTGDIVPTTDEVENAKKMMGAPTISNALKLLEKARSEHGHLNPGQNIAMCLLAQKTIEHCGTLKSPNYKALLTTEAKARIVGLSKQLLLSNDGQLKQNTFASRINGPSWNALCNEYDGPGLTASKMLEQFCTQDPSADSIAVFKAKGHFMRQVLELAKRAYDDDKKPLIAIAEANKLKDAIPLDRGRSRLG